MAALFIIPETWRKKGKGAKIKEWLSKLVNPYDGSVLDQTILESGLQSQDLLVRKIPLLSSSVKWVCILNSLSLSYKEEIIIVPTLQGCCVH